MLVGRRMARLRNGGGGAGFSTRRPPSGGRRSPAAEWRGATSASAKDRVFNALHPSVRVGR
jgi:hypothetical protein